MIPWGDSTTYMRIMGMPKFFALPKEVKRKLIDYFENKAIGTKIKYLGKGT